VLPPFDPAKDAKNQKDHGLSLVFGEKVVADSHAIELIDDRFPYGEERWNVLGMVNGKIYVTTYTDREDGLRYISVRAATKRETSLYFERNTDV
jgi:uncharacterized DUF497 family protein